MDETVTCGYFHHCVYRQAGPKSLPVPKWLVNLNMKPTVTITTDNQLHSDSYSSMESTSQARNKCNYLQSNLYLTLRYDHRHLKLREKGRHISYGDSCAHCIGLLRLAE